jgi:hypothetical protein
VDLMQITELRSWATRLEERSESNDELRAAARAIRMLVDEVENLQARLVVSDAGAPPPASAEPPPVTEAPLPGTPSRRAAPPSLLDRLKHTLGFE